MTIDASLDKRLARLVRPAVPIKGALIIACLFIAFKAILLPSLGQATMCPRSKPYRLDQFWIKPVPF